jgi:hypothetical protein
MRFTCIGRQACPLAGAGALRAVSAAAISRKVVAPAWRAAST